MKFLRARNQFTNIGQFKASNEQYLLFLLELVTEVRNKATCLLQIVGIPEKDLLESGGQNLLLLNLKHKRFPLNILRAKYENVELLFF